MHAMEQRRRKGSCGASSPHPGAVPCLCLFRRCHLGSHCRASGPLKKMTESCGQEQTRWITTVIMSTALQDHEISTILQRQQHRVRYSESVETGSVIFPLSGVAFILSDTQDLLRTGEEQFSERIQKFIGIHRNSFLVLSAALHGSEEWNVMFRIQKSDHALDQAAQRGGGVSLTGDIPEPSGRNPVQCVLRRPCLSRKDGPDEPS
ncbi:uncharacterized protein C1orf146 homolog isoform X4 [Pipra filicauda]|uniref:Uncharacterized protein C1orf146 homolog isoform X4 n=1 Tax=Pipra filicauda TaxID=649802 RepID=A0A7R5KPT8_9PASS|nr:uncharacterized protein C1orf146 homolog isoform X4 [Pipra filicauda]